MKTQQQTVLIVSDNTSFISALSMILNSNNRIIYINPLSSDIHTSCQFFATDSLLTLINISGNISSGNPEIGHFLKKLKSISTHYFIINENRAEEADIVNFITRGNIQSRQFSLKKDPEDKMPEYLNELGKYELTRREIEVFRCIMKGLSYKETSETLFVSLDTVRTHIRNIYLKMDVNSKSEAVSRIMKIN